VSQKTVLLLDSQITVYGFKATWGMEKTSPGLCPRKWRAVWTSVVNYWLRCSQSAACPSC